MAALAGTADTRGTRCETRRRALVLAVLLVGLAALVPQAAPRHPIVVLVSLDGWRWDYMERASTPNLRALAARGVRAEGLIPSFPTKTFPNHYTIVTGLYPEHHGIVSNTIVDPEFPPRFTMASATARDAHWWGGEPIWVSAIQQGLRASSMFWPGSEAPIRGVRPTEWRSFDDRIPSAERVRQVLDWLGLPEAQRPSLITLYLSEVDHAGHDFGPDSPQLLEAAHNLDEAIGQLVSGAEALGLADRLDIVAVSDHGMSPLSRDRIIFLDDYVDLSTVTVVEWTPVVELIPRTGSVDQLVRALRGHHPSLAVYRREQVPPRLHYSRNERIPPVIGIAADGWMVTSHARLADDDEKGRLHGGDHGYDIRAKSMQGLFVAAGPDIRGRQRVPPFANVHIYDFLCRLLDIRPASNDGDAAVTRPFLLPRG
jgi:predicted AlkP superfamily pyrophosphatase or phosphodiesterase